MSGKQSKRIRRQKQKDKGISKKAIAGAAAIALCSAPLIAEGGEFILSAYPNISFPVIKFDDTLTTGFGGGLSLTYRPVEFLNIYAQGDYKQYRFNTKKDIGSLSVISGDIGAGYHLPIGDRMGVDLNAGVGYYNSNYQNGTGDNKKTTSINGLRVTGSIGFSYKINPVFSVYGAAAADHLAYKEAKFITSADVMPGLSINLTKAFSNKTNIAMDNTQLKPVFPVFYSWYNENTFGSVEITNNEDASITDVVVSFYHPQYMGQSQACGTAKQLKRGESMVVDLRAFFNESMLNLNEKNDTMTSIIVEYKYLGRKQTATFPMIVPIYGRNNMSWEDDRCASAFVSSKDPAAMWFSKYVVSTIRDNVRSGLPTNIQYAMGIFEALDQFGINYVKDPTSAFEDNVGTASIDFLQFPYQTLMYRGGDCDDLSILVCSLFESIGIRTAFITIPGHIFMAFDSGFTVEEAKNYFISLDELIVDGDTVWVPLEITLSDEGFNKAWHKGAWEWNVADRTGDAMLYRMEDSWKIYKPVNVPGAVARFTLPDETYVAKLFSHSVDEFVLEQITPFIAYYENRIAAAPTAENYNDFGVLYARYGLFEQAEQQFRMARSKKYEPSVLNTANLYFSIKDYDRAINWYNEVLSADSENLLAKLGLARCAYEKGDYYSCDKYYGEVYNSDRALAKKYAYLGAFEASAGRSYSLADRLENTIWLNSTNGNSYESTPIITPQLAEQTTDVVVKSQKPEPAAEDLEALNTVAAVIPASAEEETKKEELEEDSLEGGNDGDGDKDIPETTQLEPESEVVEPVETTDTYKGITSELDFNLLSVDDLVALAEEAIESGAIVTETAVAAAEIAAVVEPVVGPIEEPVAPVVEPVETTDTQIAEIVPEPEIIPEPELAVEEETAVAIEMPVAEEIAVAIAETEEPADNSVIPALDAGIQTAQTDLDLRVEPEDDTFVAEADIAVVEPVETTNTTVAVAEPESPVVETEPAVVEPVETTEELADAFETTEELEPAVEIAEAPVEEAPAEDEEPEEKLEPAPTTAVTSLLTDVPVRAVPRFTTQPSEEWAPKEAYEVDTIPGMKSFDEEMGNYQNEKAFLYKDEYSFAVNPGEEIEDKKEEDTATLAALEINPFSSFLSEEAAQKMEKITNFTLEDVQPVAEVPVADKNIETVIPALDAATFAEQTRSGISAAQTEKDLRVKPEDDNYVAKDDTEVAADTSENVIPVLDTATFAEQTRSGIQNAQADSKATLDAKASTKSNKIPLAVAGGLAAAGLITAAGAIIISKKRKEDDEK